MSASVGIDLKNWGVSCRNVRIFAQELKFKADFYSKMSVCRHELGGGGFNPQPPPLDNSNPDVSTVLLSHFLSYTASNYNLFSSPHDLCIK